MPTLKPAKIAPTRQIRVQNITWQHERFHPLLMEVIECLSVIQILPSLRSKHLVLLVLLFVILSHSLSIVLIFVF